MAPSSQPRYVARSSKETKAKLVAARADRIAQLVEWHHELGTLALKRNLAPGWIAQKYGISLSTATKAKAFAKSYNKSQLREYLRLRRRDGLPLNIGYVPLLLTLPTKARTRFQQKIARNGWLPPEAYRQRKVQFPKKRRDTTGSVGGRPSKYKPGTQEHLQALIELAERLAKGLEQLGPHRARGAHLKSLRATTHWLTRLASR